MPYQSFHSFVAAFCTLNRITPRRFRNYWQELFPADRLYISRIAKLLDEPRPIVQTVFGKGGGDLLNKDTLSYCPACISKGFHGYFHEDPGFRRCPIHGIDLYRDFIRSKFPSNGGQYIESLAHLLEQANEDWPLSSWNPEMVTEWKQTTLLGKLLRWEGSVSHAMAGWQGLNCFVSEPPCGYHPFSHLDIKLGRLGWHTSISEQLSTLFLVKPWPAHPVIYQCDDDLAREMAMLADRVGISLLLQTYRAASHFEGRPPSYGVYVDEAIKTFLSGHDRTQCTCVWGWGKYTLWMRYEPGVIGEYCSVICPHRYAAEELSAEWVKLFPESPRKKASMLSDYRQCAALLVERGVGEEIAVMSDAWYRVPLVRLRCSPAAIKMLDTILGALAKAHVEELAHWLAAIQAGTSAETRDIFPASVFLVSNHRGIDSVLVWPAGGGRAFEDEATKSWFEGFKAKRLASAD